MKDITAAHNLNILQNLKYWQIYSTKISKTKNVIRIIQHTIQDII